MITVHSPKYGVQDTKGLGVIWGLYPTLYNEKNTIHIDDLARNFLMNPKNVPIATSSSSFLTSSSFYLPLAPLLDLSSFSFSFFQGLKIKPFRQAPLHRATDRVLKKLAKYLVAIAPVDDLRTLNHNEWESYLRRRKRARTSKGEE
jgi:ubiquitin-like domain-containing CTD phosphatase 1